MSICIAIRESELEEAVDLLDNKKFVYKCLFDSSNKDDYHTEDLGMNKLRDCLMFSGTEHLLRSLKVKTKGAEINTAVRNICSAVFEDERHLAVVNDYVNHPYMVLVFSNTFNDKSQNKSNTKITLNNNIIEKLMKVSCDEFMLLESMKISSLELYKSGIIQDTQEEYNNFIDRQKQLVRIEQNNFKEDLMKHFNEAFKFRLITYYSKLREFSLDEIMGQLNKMGYLDERFKVDCDIYEEEARIILARRLCTLSFKSDIEVLIKKGIMSPDMIQYDIGLSF